MPSKNHIVTADEFLRVSEEVVHAQRALRGLWDVLFDVDGVERVVDRAEAKPLLLETGSHLTTALAIMAMSKEVT